MPTFDDVLQAPLLAYVLLGGGVSPYCSRFFPHGCKRGWTENSMRDFGPGKILKPAGWEYL